MINPEELTNIKGQSKIRFSHIIYAYNHTITI